eukprot:TRINITY_DN69_c0_g1_i1.p1 TRINITY_DN69_c0_g1~~TRINITY_DN69_c0_g1_i1.p1  ORF type:complete len:193 (-),score=50.09 TRINITY_DN69_c0_g1_i1:510-1088(-)
MAATRKRFLVCLDGSPPSDAALSYALTQVNPDLDELFLIVGVKHGSSSGLSTAQAEHTAKAMALLKETSQKLKVQGFRHIQAHVIQHSHPKRTICNFASHLKIDQIFVGTRGLSKAKEFLIGSFSHYLSNHAPCPVVIVRSGDSTEKDSFEPQPATYTDELKSMDDKDPEPSPAGEEVAADSAIEVKAESSS